MEIQQLYNAYLSTTGVCTDTRQVTDGCMFFALKGGNFDGNQFAGQAIEQGALYAVVDDPEFANGANCILVDDVLSTLQELANYYRKQFQIPFIGITGSNGKTTTKELVYTALSVKYKVHATKGNFNNHIGVPLTLLSIPLDTEIAIIEMGANHIGEIEALCKIAEPTHGFITNIGKAHLEGFGSLEGVARGKSELYMSLMKSGGQVFVNAQDEHLTRMCTRIKEVKKYLSPDGYNLTLKNASPYLEVETKNGVSFQTNLLGTYNFPNIAVAMCLADFFDVEEEKALQAIAEYNPSNNRSQVVKKDSNSIILDAYNANPTSVAAALENFNAIDFPNKVVILGDMFELGAGSEAEHRGVLSLCESLGFDRSFFIGKEFNKVKSDFGTYFLTKEDFLKENKLSDYKETMILIKGSRGIGLEKLLEA